MADGDGSVKSLDLLPSAVLATIMTKLDLPSICSLASTCRIFHSCASQILNFLPTFHLLV
uniref:F-box domain-containing protein n=1 Tax=Cucumis melo TaxID=3656 RepID=A0A9I9E2J0_CUCME